MRAPIVPKFLPHTLTLMEVFVPVELYWCEFGGTRERMTTAPGTKHKALRFDVT